MMSSNAKRDNGSKFQNEDTALNTKLKKMMALNSKPQTMALNAKLEMRL